ncbi:MAG: hypothetical protein ACE5GV_05880 [Candidatus Scalindua sp.]
MGLFGFFAHKSTKKSIRKNIEFYKGLHPDKRAGMIFYVWLGRGINLSEVAGNPNLFIPIEKIKGQTFIIQLWGNMVFIVGMYFSTSKRNGNG